MLDENNQALTSPIGLPVTNRGGRPIGSRSKFNKMAFDAREACIEAGENPYRSLALFLKHADPLIVLAACKMLLPYMGAPYKSVEYGGADPNALTVTLNLVPYGKADDAE